MPQVNPTLGLLPVDADIMNFLEEVTQFYGHGTPQARMCDKIKRRLQTVSPKDKYERECPTCKCPLCGKTRAQAMAVRKSQRLRGHKKFLTYVDLSQVEDDEPEVNLPEAKQHGFSVLDIAKFKADAFVYVNKAPLK